MSPAGLAETMQGPSLTWIKKKAVEKSADITGSLMIQEDGRFYNRLIWAKPDGRILTYDKKHLFRMSGEEKVYSPGTRRLTVELKGWRIRPFICYDLRFPELFRLVAEQVDVSILIASWPNPRQSHFNTLLEARAIENQQFVVGVNRVGTGGGLEFSGGSTILDPLGNRLAVGEDKERLIAAELDLGKIEETRKFMSCHHDRRF